MSTAEKRKHEEGTDAAAHDGAATAATADGANGSEAKKAAISAEFARLHAALEDGERPDNEKARDKNRLVARVLEWIGADQCKRVIDLTGCDGYWGRLFAAMHPDETVYVHNIESWKFFLNDLMAPHLKYQPGDKRPAHSPENAHYYWAPLTDIAPPAIKDTAAGSFDLVMFYACYHDMEKEKVDRAAMNEQAFTMLKPGGLYVVADHSAPEGAGFSLGATVHRVEESTVVSEVKAAGFELIDTADILRKADDPRTEMAAVWDRPQPFTDRFVLKFQKPHAK